MKEILQGVAAIIGIILLIVVLSFAGNALGLFNIKFWGTKYENANREVFEQTKSFRDGSVRDLDNLKLEYLRAKIPEEKASIRDVMRHRADGIPQELIAPDVRNIINGDQ